MKTAIRLTYTLGGTDPAAFDINVSTGQLKTKGALDYEAQSTYSIEVTATVPPPAPVPPPTLPSWSPTRSWVRWAVYMTQKKQDDRMIDKEEAIAAVGDYFSGDLTNDQTIEIIRLYFTSAS